MTSFSGRNAAWLTLVWPGFGQLAQGRWAAGVAFAVWAAFNAVALAAPSLLGASPKLIGADLVLATVWAFIDAYRFKRPMAGRHAA